MKELNFPSFRFQSKSIVYKFGFGPPFTFGLCTFFNEHHICL